MDRLEGERWHLPSHSDSSGAAQKNHRQFSRNSLIHSENSTDDTTYLKVSGIRRKLTFDYFTSPRKALLKLMIKIGPSPITDLLTLNPAATALKRKK